MNEHMNHYVNKAVPTEFETQVMLGYIHSGNTDPLHVSVQALVSPVGNTVLKEFDQLINGRKELQEALSLMRDPSVGLTTQGIVKNFMSGLQSSWSTMKDLLSMAKSKESGYTEFKPKDLNKFKQGALTGKYGVMVDYPTATPVGMNANYLSYLKMVNEANIGFEGLDKLVDAYRMKIGELLSSQDGVKNPESFDSTYFRQTTAKMMAFQGRLKEYTDPKDQTASKPFGQLFDNTGEFYETLQLTVESTANNNKIDRHALMASLATLDEYFKEVVRIARKDGFSRKIIEEVAETTHCVASAVEAFAAVTFIQRMVNVAMDTNVKEFAGFI